MGEDIEEELSVLRRPAQAPGGTRHSEGEAAGDGDLKGCVCLRAKSLQSRPTLFDPLDCIPPGSSVHGILQARLLECVARPCSRGAQGVPRLWGQSECSHAAARHWEGLSPALHEGPMRG